MNNKIIDDKIMGFDVILVSDGTGRKTEYVDKADYYDSSSEFTTFYNEGRKFSRGSFRTSYILAIIPRYKSEET